MELNLKELKLYSNKLKIIKDTKFNNLKNLEILHLHKNEINLIEIKITI